MGGIGTDHTVCIDTGGIGALCAACSLIITTDPDRTAAGGTRRIKRRITQGDVFTCYGNLSALTNVRCGRNLARYGDVALAPTDDDLAIVTRHAVRLDHTRQIDRMAGRIAGTRDRDQHRTAIGRQSSLVIDQGVLVFRTFAGRKGDLQKAVARKVQRRLFARTQTNLAKGGSDQAFVLYRPPNECCITIATNRDNACIADTCRGTIAFKDKVTL